MAEHTTGHSLIKSTHSAILDLAKEIQENQRLTDRRVVAACRDVTILVNFTINSIDTSSPPPSITIELLASERYAATFGELRPIVADFKSCLRAIQDAGPEEKVVDGLCATLAKIAASLRRTLRRVVDVFTEIVEKETAEGTQDEKQRIHQDRARKLCYDTLIELANRELFLDAQSLLQDLEDTRAASGPIVAGSLGLRYEDHAKKERRVAEVLRVISVAVLLFVAGVAIEYVLTAEHLTFEAQLIKLSASIPLLLLAGYLARESAQHRAAARWSSELGIALHTLPTYTDHLTEEDKSACRRALGMRIVAAREHPPPKKSDKEDEPQALSDDLSGVIDAARKIQVVLLDPKLPGTGSISEK